MLVKADQTFMKIVNDCIGKLGKLHLVIILQLIYEFVRKRAKMLPETAYASGILC